MCYGGDDDAYKMSRTIACANVQADVLLVGGGLANSLIALRLKALRPALKIIMFEQDQHPAPHTWSLFRTDVSVAIWNWLAPLAGHRWRGYDVLFPGYQRTLINDYASLLSGPLRAAVADALGEDLHCGVQVSSLAPNRAQTDDGQVFTAPLVIDGRGARPSAHMALAWQKFVGLELTLTQPHKLDRPIVMDATVTQLDGFRFLYVLPLSDDRLLVEDTRYSDGADLDAKTLEAQVMAYVQAKGWGVRQVERQESGVLPVVLGGDVGAFWDEIDADTPQAGLRAALFHPTTGYSLPEAARLADSIANAPTLTSAVIAPLIRARSKRLWRKRSVFRLVNRMMFLAAAPEQRYRVLERFYRLSPRLIERFYAGDLTLRDRARLLVGKPPVPFFSAVAVLPERVAFSRNPHD